jgi:hypothetical protein
MWILQNSSDYLNYQQILKRKRKTGRAEQIWADRRWAGPDLPGQRGRGFNPG